MSDEIVVSIDSRRVLTLNEIRARLVDRRLSIVAKRCGLSRTTVAEISSGVAENPRMKTVILLSDYLLSGGYHG